MTPLRRTLECTSFCKLRTSCADAAAAVASAMAMSLSSMYFVILARSLLTCEGLLISFPVTGSNLFGALPLPFRLVCHRELIKVDITYTFARSMTFPWTPLTLGTSLLLHHIHPHRSRNSGNSPNPLALGTSWRYLIYIHVHPHHIHIHIVRETQGTPQIHSHSGHPGATSYTFTYILVTHIHIVRETQGTPQIHSHSGHPGATSPGIHPWPPTYALTIISFSSGWHSALNHEGSHEGSWYRSEF